MIAFIFALIGIGNGRYDYLQKIVDSTFDSSQANNFWTMASPSGLASWRLRRRSCECVGKSAQPRFTRLFPRYSEEPSGGGEASSWISLRICWRRRLLRIEGEADAESHISRRRIRRTNPMIVLVHQDQITTISSASLWAAQSHGLMG